jgi:sporadic carbohydrate cluster protein (TIGR04323 family)
MANEFFHTYTLPRPFRDMNIPINVQSCFLRDYCNKYNFTYVLPQTEIINSGSIYILKELVREISEKKSLIGVTSLFMLPYNDTERLKTIQTIDTNDNVEWHFPLESIICKTSKLLTLTETHHWFEALASKSAIPAYHTLLRNGKNSADRHPQL